MKHLHLNPLIRVLQRTHSPLLTRHGHNQDCASFCSQTLHLSAMKPSIFPRDNTSSGWAHNYRCQHVSLNDEKVSDDALMKQESCSHQLLLCVFHQRSLDAHARRTCFTSAKYVVVKRPGKRE